MSYKVNNANPTRRAKMAQRRQRQLDRKGTSPEVAFRGQYVPGSGEFHNLDKEAVTKERHAMQQEKREFKRMLREAQLLAAKGLSADEEETEEEAA